MSILFHTDILLDDYSVLKNAYLGVTDNTITCIGAEKPRETYETTRTLSRHLLIPGLYNLHTHSPMVLMRGIGNDLPLHRWLDEAVFPIEERLEESDISVGTRLAMLEMLASGIVSFTDMYDHTWTTAREVEQAGMKANLNRPIIALDHEEPYEQNSHVAESLAFFDDCNGMADGRIIADFGIHAEYTSHADVVRKYGEACKERGAIMHLHLSETRKEHDECKARNNGKTPAEWFNDLGVFDNPTIAAHCVMLDPNDIEILREKGVTAVHNPSSNMKLGSGFMPISHMLTHGVKLALGTDGAASNNNLNLFEEMHLASIIHKGYTGDPTLLSPRELLSMATIAGAKAQGRKSCGALKVGNRADVVALDLDKPHLMPIHDIPALLVYAAQGSDVAMTMVDGKILFDKGEYLSIDTERVRYDLDQSMARLF